MMGFASRTGTRRNITALRDAGWGWMIGPLDHGGDATFRMPHALDNGAWPAFEQKVPWNRSAFERCLDIHGAAAQFIVAPDVVADREASLARTREWLPRLMGRHDLRAPRVLIAVQDGMTHRDIEQLADRDPRIGIFIGGSTEWKEAAIIPWGRWADERELYCHVGRVNSVRRINLCIAGKVKSIDGTSLTRYASNIGRLDTARHQMSLL